MKSFRQIGLVIGLMLFSLTVASAQNDPGQAYFNRGQFEMAAQYWHEALSNENNSKRYIDTSVRLSAAYLSLGRLKEAFRVLESAQNVADKIADPVRQASVLMQFSDVYLAMRHLKDEDKQWVKQLCQKNTLFNWKGKKIIDEALDCLKEAKSIAPPKDNAPLLWANLLNKEGNVLFQQAKDKQGDDQMLAEENYSDALSSYNESVDLAKKAGDKVLSAKTSINIIQLGELFGLDKIVKNELKNRAIFGQVKDLPDDTHDKAFAFISLAQLIQTLKPPSSKEKSEKLSYTNERLSYAYEALMRAICIAKNQKYNPAHKDDPKHQRACVAKSKKYSQQILHYNKRTIAYAKGYLAELYEEKQRYPEAIQLTREAIFYAQSYPKLLQIESRKELQRELWSYPELLYRLEWQLGKWFEKHRQLQGVIDVHQHAVEYAQREVVIDAYKRAEKHLQLVRQRYRCGSQPFEKNAKQFYFELRDLLLQQATQAPIYKKQALLKAARDSIESFHDAELREYFVDDCVTEFENKITDVDQFLSEHPNIAVLYPILLEDHVELLLSSHKGGIQRFVSNINKADLKTKVDDFRTKLQQAGKIKREEMLQQYHRKTRMIGVEDKDVLEKLEELFQHYLRSRDINTMSSMGNRNFQNKNDLRGLYQSWGKPDYEHYKAAPLSDHFNKWFDDLYVELLNDYYLDMLPKAQEIYDLLLKHVVQVLLKDSQINTLMIVPDGILRTLPFAALHDGQNFIIQKYAIVVTSGIKLTNPTKVMQGGTRVSLNGSNKFEDDNIPKLPYVKTELKGIQRILYVSEKDMLFGEKFTRSNMETKFKSTPYSIVHFATHGHIGSGPDEIYLLTYNDKITINHLKGLIDLTKSLYHHSINLLTLSACETAVGDDRGTLGLAGIALKVGVPSTLGTLWSVNDVATSRLMVNFYGQLKQLPSARALQEAQKLLIATDKHKHPYFWASFLLMGSGL
ncbi:MAG: hypothetical protein DRR16_15330 [Candidatus Parabeggiatoa sp. nov. 3]|nr:MAG: hypothetical protein DRR00_16405 [Gammaproteobacteria bacterium]RKZ68672.1 MAG: hypothetical protein DRQ99_03170 [Gammaproteobacteria bacterium]RKZ84208.1 MAG: hypothetical protein DRR16_15330 [Gammaproteobacteria bacterium]